MAVTVGILGFAHGHVGMYCGRWREAPEMGVSVIAGWDHDAERAKRAAERHGVRLFDSPEALLASDVEGVVIAAETSRHAELVEFAAEAGKAVVLQKPMALTLEEADRIVAAVAKAGVPFTMAWQMRVDPQNLKMKSLVESGEFGKVYVLRRRHCLSTQLMKDFDRSWHVDPALNRDIFADDAAHPIDFIYWFLGMPASVIAEMGTLRNAKIPNDNAIAVFRYADGTFAEVSCSFACVGGENTTEVVCENGIIVQNYGDAPSTSVPRPEGGIPLKWFLHGSDGWTVSDLPDVDGQGGRIAALAGPLAEFLRGERPPIATAEEGRTVLALVLACYESVEQGKRVELGNG
ncbi:MAG: Gfo/Idh/MocA family protein [Planctomycetota bacterium]|jgi:predicted dehydrogenase